MKNNNLKSLDQFIDEQYGKRGSTKRDKFEEGYEAFKLGVLLQLLTGRILHYFQ